MKRRERSWPQRVLLRFLPWAAATLLLAALALERLDQAVLEPVEAAQARAIVRGGRVLAAALGHLGRDIDILSHHEVLLSAAADDGADPVGLARLTDLFHAFSAASRDYDQIRWIDASGRQIEKIAMFKEQKELGWIVASSTAIEELTAASAALARWLPAAPAPAASETSAPRRGIAARAPRWRSAGRPRPSSSPAPRTA